MTPAFSRYLLFTETLPGGADDAGWRFLLHAVDADHTVSASDREPGLRSDRLALMAVVRGLEALAQPSAVKLVTTSNYVRRGVMRGLSEWRNNGWRWERFGKLAPVRDADLWRRVDRALGFHRVTCRGWRPLSHDWSSEGSSDSRAASRVAARPRNRITINPEAAIERVVEGGINEPALLVVRGKRRHVFRVNRGEASPTEALAAAG